MLYLPKEKAVLALVVSSLILFAFMLLVTTNTITNVSAVEANEARVGVYWDSNCTDRVFSIDWGTLTPGLMKSVVVYIRNEVEEPAYLILSTTNWNPSKASQYLNLGWDYSGQRMNLGETLQITLTLSISPYIEGISSFSFDIFIKGYRVSPVGGIYIPVNKLELLAPYIGLTILLAVAVISVGYVKKRKRDTEIIS